jgi:hypothetical protein
MIELAKCGCGGNAVFVQGKTPYEWAVVCETCFVGTPFLSTQEDAAKTWHRAMGKEAKP